MNRLALLIKNPHFRKFLIANTLVDLGRKLSWVALGWFVFHVTGSMLSIGLVISSATISPLLSYLLVGGLMDRFNRRTMLMAENMLRGLLLSLIPVMYWLDHLSMAVILTVVFIDGFLSSFTSVGRAAILPSFVEKDDLEAANAFSSMISQGGYFLGPTIGGFCVAYFGEPMTLFVNVVCFIFSALLIYSIPDEVYNRGVTKLENARTLKGNLQKIGLDTKEGFAFIFTHRSLMMMALCTFLFNMAYGPLEPMLPVFVSDVLYEGPEVLGLMWTFFAVGTVSGSMLWMKISRKSYYSFVLGSVVFFWGLASMSIGFSGHKFVAFAILFIGGVVYAPYNIVAPTLRQSLVPTEIRGRVFSTNSLLGGLGLPLGVYLGGVIGNVVGASNMIIYAGMTCMALGVLIFLHPALRFKEAKTLDYKRSESAGVVSV